MRSHLDYLAESRRQLPAPDAAARPREGDNDGGYAVADYDAVDPRLGTMADLDELAAPCTRRGIALCVDLVLNHTAAEHAWARRPPAGDPAYRGLLPLLSRTAPSPTRTSGPLPDIFPGHRAGQLHLRRRARRAGSGRRSTATSGTSTRPTRSLPGDARRDAHAWPTAASTCCGWTPRRSCGSAAAPTA